MVQAFDNLHHSKEDLDWAWVVLVATFLGHCLSGIVAANGVFNVIFLDIFPEKDATKCTVAFISLNQGLLNLCVPLFAPLTSRYGARPIALAGAVVCGLGCFFASFAQSLAEVIISYGVISGIGLGLFNSASHASVWIYFPKFQAFVTELVNMGIPFGGLLYVCLLDSIIETMAWREMMLVCSGCLFHLCIIAVLLKPVSKSHRNKKPSQQKPTEETQVPGEEHCFLKLIRNASFILFLGNLFVVAFARNAIAYHLPAGVMWEHGGLKQAIYLLAAYYICHLVSWFSAAAAIHFNCGHLMSLYVASNILSGTLLIMAPQFMSSFHGEFLITISVSYCGNMFVVFMTPIAAQMVGLVRMKTTENLQCIVCGLGDVAGPVVAGLLFDYYKTYNHMYISCGVLYFVGACVMFWVRVTEQLKQCIHRDAGENMLTAPGAMVMDHGDSAEISQAIDDEKSGRTLKLNFSYSPPFAVIRRCKEPKIIDKAVPCKRKGVASSVSRETQVNSNNNSLYIDQKYSRQSDLRRRWRSHLL